MVDGVDVQGRLRPLVAEALREAITARDGGHGSDHDYETLAWSEVIVNGDDFRDFCNRKIFGGS